MKQKINRNLLPLLVTSMVVIAPLLFILGLVIGNQLHGNVSLTGDSISSWLSAIATVAIAGLIFVLAKETWYLREAQILQLDELRRENIRPNVSVQLVNSSAEMNFMNVKVSNFGKGIARKIEFEFLDRSGHPVVVKEDAVVKQFHKLALFRLGIESMGIGQEISSFLFSFFELGGELKGKIFEPYIHIVVKFEDVESRQYKNSFVVDFAQYEGMSDVGGNALHKMAAEIKRIRESLGKMASGGSNRVGIDIFDASDRDAEAVQSRDWMEEQREGRKIARYDRKKLSRRQRQALRFVESMFRKQQR